MFLHWLQSNEELIQNYGFFLQDNRQDFAWVSVAVRPEDPLASLRTEVLARAGLDVANDSSDRVSQSITTGDDGHGTGIRFYLRRFVALDIFLCS